MRYRQVTGQGCSHFKPPLDHLKANCCNCWRLQFHERCWTKGLSSSPCHVILSIGVTTSTEAIFLQYKGFKTERDRQTDRGRERWSETERQRKKETERHIQRLRQRERWTQRQRETETERSRETERERQDM